MLGTVNSPTLDQLRILVTVADAGSFTAAARRMNRAQSVVSYALANLETTLGISLFERGRRRPTLTEAGQAVLADARQVARAVDELRARATGLIQGLEASVALAVDVMFPTGRLVEILEAYAAEFPTVSLRLRVEAIGGVVQLVRDGECAIGISGWMGSDLDVFAHRDIGAVRLIPVAAPSHRLTQFKRPLGPDDLRDETQLVLTDRSMLSEGQDFGVLSLKTWRLGDLGAKHALLRAGVGWGNMPEHAVSEDIAARRLVHLDLPKTADPMYRLLLIHRIDTPPGPAGRWLLDKIGSAERLPPI